MSYTATIGKTGYCHRGDHDLCPHAGADPTRWRSSGRSDDPGFGPHPDCACACHTDSPTGWCATGQHQRCRYGHGNEFPQGIILSDGPTQCRYMCSCACHVYASWEVEA